MVVMQATSDSNVSSSTNSSSQLLETPSTSTDALLHPSTYVTNTSSAPDDGEEACVSSLQEASASSDENEADGDSGEPDDSDDDSEISEFSDFSQESWQPVQGPIAWVQEQMRRGQSPRKILEDLVPPGTVIPEGLDTIMLWKIIINIVSEPPKRKKLNDINTLNDVLRLLNTSKKIIVLTGAGVSVSCGIPDFRSQDGVYARLAKDFPNLPDPQAMFDIHFFRNDPRPFFKFAREIYPGQFKPSPCHRFIRLLEEKGKLLRNYSQNIDTLEQIAGIQRVIQCHGSFATATCTVCGHKVNSDAIREDIFNQVIPHCPRCSPSNQNAVMKPDIVFFGESLPEHFHSQMAADKDECDLLIVIGSSLKVRPVALIPNSLPQNIPQILINRERLPYLNFDVELLGNCDDIIGELCRGLGPGWEELAAAGPPISEILISSLPTPPTSPHASQDRWEDADNPAVSSSEAFMISSDKKQEHHTVSEVSPDKESQVNEKSDPKATSAPVLHNKDNFDDAQEVSTSHSETILVKSHKGHHNPSSHKHFLKRSFSSTKMTAETPSDQKVPSLPGPDEASDAFCSPKEVENLVCACHRKDVMYIPSEKSTYGHHSQQSHDRTKPHTHYHHHPHHHGLPSLTEQSSSPKHTIQHSNELSMTTTSSIFDDNSGLFTSPIHQETTSESKIETPYKPSQTLPSCSPSTSAAVSLNDEEVPDEGPHRSKKPRLSLKTCQEEDSIETEGEGREVVDEGMISACDSVSQEGSAGDIRKLWRGRCRVSLAQRLTNNQVLFLPPSRYIFKGAEVFSGSDTDDSDDSMDNDDDASDQDDNEEHIGDNKNSVDKVTKDVISSEKSQTKDKLDSLAADSSEEGSSQQKIVASVNDGIVTSGPSSPVQKTSAEAEDTHAINGNDVSIQRNICSSQPSSDIPFPQDKMSDTTACPVSSTEDFALEQTGQINSGLHSLQGQRD